MGHKYDKLHLFNIYFLYNLHRGGERWCGVNFLVFSSNSLMVRIRSTDISFNEIISLQPQVPPSQEPSTSSNDTQSAVHLSSRYTVSEEHQKAKEQFMEKERENARMEAKRRKLMEKRVRIYEYN